MSIPFFFPPPRHVSRLPAAEKGEIRHTLLSLCEALDTPCRASGEWVTRTIRIRIDPGAEGVSIMAETGPCGPVLLTLKTADAGEKEKIALAAMAYALHDPVARKSIRGMAWNRISPKKGRKPLPRAQTSREVMGVARPPQGFWNKVAAGKLPHPEGKPPNPAVADSESDDHASASPMDGFCP